MSGIQPYIYQITSKYASKNLKGRSFYIKLLNDAIVRYIIKELGLSFEEDVIYNSGGSFCILAPATESVKNKLTSVIDSIENKLFSSHGMNLFVAVDYVEVSDPTKGLQEAWGELFRKRDQKKRCKSSSILKSKYGEIFEPESFGGDVKIDEISGDIIRPGEKCRDVEGIGTVKEENWLQIVLGEKLKKAKCYVVSHGTPRIDGTVAIEPAGLGFHYTFHNEVKPDSVPLSGWDNEQFTYEQLCDCENGDFTRLGVLRMDVDNLGLVFQNCINKEDATLYDYRMLSKRFDTYFSKNIYSDIFEKVDPKHSFIVYSGGDDIFAVGRWDVMIDLAEKIHTKFSEHFGRSEFSISGGVAIVEPKFPIMKAASMSAEEEENAKNHRPEKNSFSMMGMALTWESEFPAVKHLTDAIVKEITNGKLKRAFIHKLQTMRDMANIKCHKVTNHKVYWMMAYDMSRTKTRTGGSNPLLENCIKETCSQGTTLNGERIVTNYSALELWSLAARWAELRLRSNNKRINDN